MRGLDLRDGAASRSGLDPLRYPPLPLLLLLLLLRILLLLLELLVLLPLEGRLGRLRTRLTLRYLETQHSLLALVRKSAVRQLMTLRLANTIGIRYPLMPLIVWAVSLSARGYFTIALARPPAHAGAVL